MLRTAGVLAGFAWAVCGLALGQEPSSTQPVPELPGFAAGNTVPPSQTPTSPPAATGQQPAAPADPAKTAEALEKLTKTVETLGKNLTVVTGDEKIKLVLGGSLTADFYFNQARPVAPGIPFFLGVPSPFGFRQNTFDANARATT